MAEDDRRDATRDAVAKEIEAAVNDLSKRIPEGRASRPRAPRSKPSTGAQEG